MRHVLRRAWGRVKWKMIAIVTLTGGSAILIACLAAASIDVIMRREAANLVEKQIQTLVEASRSIAPAMLENVPACSVADARALSLTSLLKYTGEAFPGAQASLQLEDSSGVHFILPPSRAAHIQKPTWLPANGFTGLTADGGELEIRGVAERKRSGCLITAVFSFPLGPELAKRLSIAGNLTVTPVRQSVFRVHAANRRILQTIDSNFVAGSNRPVAVVLSVREWKTGALEDWLAYRASSTRYRTLADLSRFGQQRANWVWLLCALSALGGLLYASGVWIGIRLSREIVVAVDDLGAGARQIGSGNFAFRMAVPGRDQLGKLASDFNGMAVALEGLRQQERAQQRLESEIQVARSVQAFLFPRSVPVLEGVTISGRTQPARLLGGDLYDYFQLTPKRVRLFCADVSGKGIPAALMMSNLQALARAESGADHFVEALNRQLTGRFGDNRYATLFWIDFDAYTGGLRYINAGHPSAILIHATGQVERLESNGFPIGMFQNARYTAKEVSMLAGSRLIVFTDGFTDALNSIGEELGDDRLVTFCKNSLDANMDADAIAEALTSLVTEWSGPTEQFDDATVVVIAVTSEPG